MCFRSCPLSKLELHQLLYFLFNILKCEKVMSPTAGYGRVVLTHSSKQLKKNNQNKTDAGNKNLTQKEKNTKSGFYMKLVLHFQICPSVLFILLQHSLLFFAHSVVLSLINFHIKKHMKILQKEKLALSLSLSVLAVSRSLT